MQFLSSAKDTFKLLQLSDTHLFADPAGSLVGVNTRNSFMSTLAQIKQNHKNIDAIVVTGDISQDLSAASYLFFAEQMEKFNCPILCIPGNHDEVDLLKRYVSSEKLRTGKKFQTNHWQVLLAHSQVKGEVFGAISSRELIWLERQISSNDKPTLVFTHHHPVSIKAQWLDLIGIKNSEELTKILSKHDNVKACGFGHVHQESITEQGGVDYYSVPSTCIQFKPKSNDFAVSNELPGYRIFHCSPCGSVTSQVHRVEDYKLTLDKSATGY